MILIGDCREKMKELIADKVKVQMCVTSPPYFGLRDYGIDGQLGMEETPEAYVKNMVEVFSLVKELLADDGTLWLNLGDSYSDSSQGTKWVYSNSKKQNTNKGSIYENTTNSRRTCELLPKNLIGIPWRVAFALQADGWYLRSDIIWHKPNPMPESVKDRPTKSHEYIFLMSKNAKYYYDAEAIKETYQGLGKPRVFAKAGNGDRNDTGRVYEARDDGGRNKRSVWTVTTKPYKGSHFATFPPKLIEPCILAGSRFGDIVLDPFGGSGTTAQVAETFGRKWIICELNDNYKSLINRRLAQQSIALQMEEK